MPRRRSRNAAPQRHEHAPTDGYPRNGPDYIEARIELHRRFALPVACIMLALVGIPAGHCHAQRRQIGRLCDRVVSGVFLLLPLVMALIGVAKQRTLPVPVAVLAAERGISGRGRSFSTAWNGPATAICWRQSPACSTASPGFSRAASGRRRRAAAAPRHAHGGCRCCRRSSIPTFFPISCFTW